MKAYPEGQQGARDIYTLRVFERQRQNGLGHMVIPTGNEAVLDPEVGRTLFEIRGLLEEETAQAKQIIAEVQEQGIDEVRRKLVRVFGKRTHEGINGKQERHQKTKKFIVWDEVIDMIRWEGKRTELRPGYHNLRGLRPGDYLTFEGKSSKDTIYAVVTDIRLYKEAKTEDDLRRLLEIEGTEKIAPGMTIDEVIEKSKILFRKGQLRKFGVILIDFELAL